uniref:Kinesin family member 27 n=1 Tax=Neovison vison TaxID=452646 RepID=A0A8C7B2E6_NEOVI
GFPSERPTVYKDQQIRVLQDDKPTSHSVWGIFFEYLSLQALSLSLLPFQKFLAFRTTLDAGDHHVRRLTSGEMRVLGTVKVVVVWGNVHFIFNHYTHTEVLYFKNVHLFSTKNEKIIEQQLLVDQLSEELSKLNLSMTSSATEPCGDGPDTRTATKRPCTVPFDSRLGHYIYIPARPGSRKVYTSPSVYSLDRVVAGFRTRSQMLLGHLEEQDEVLHCQFSDNSDDEGSEGQEKSEIRYNIKVPITMCFFFLSFPFCFFFFKDLKIECLQESQDMNLQKLRNSELILTEAKQKMRELTINIKMKEDLIKELIKTGNDAKSVSKQYSLKVTKLEHEAERAKVELTETEKQLQELENKDLSDVALKVKLQKEFRKKMDAAKLRVQVLQKKQQNSKKLASLSIQNEKRATELEQNVDHMKHQKVQLQKRLREENEKRKQLDADIKRDQQKIKELKLKSEQEEALKLRAEELDAFKMKKRNGSFGRTDQLQKMDERKKWLDEEVEKVLSQRQELEQLEEDLKKREAIVCKKEALLQEKSHLENKKLRSSQVLSTDSLKISTRLNLLDQELSEKNVELQHSTAEEKIKISERVQALQKERDQLQRRRNSVDEKLKNGSVLSPEEEHVLFQLEEGIEALEAAIEYKNESIQSRQNSLRASLQNLSRSEANVLEKLICLSPVEMRAILFRYFNKVVHLRETERKLQLQNEEMKMKVLERDNMVRELESALEHLKLQCDRRLTLQQKEHEQKMQLLLQHFQEQDGEGLMEMLKTYEDKIQQLEKDLYFYKKTSRDLKKKLKELVGEAVRRQLAASEHHDAGDRVLNPDEEGMVPEELKWASRTESMRLSGRERELDNSTSSLRTQPNPLKLWEDGPELPLICSSLAPTSGHLLNNEDKIEGDENHFTKSHSRPSPQIQLVGNVGQLHGVTSVKLCRKELRQISALELSLRRSTLGAGVRSMSADSIEVARKPNDLKT